MTKAEFLDLYPEFATAKDALLDATLAQESANLKGPYVTDRLFGLQVAEALALSPFGRDLKLVNKDGSTVYSERLTKALQVAAIHRRSL